MFFRIALSMLAAVAENTPKLANARQAPTRTINSPIKTRILKKADCEVDFFFMSSDDFGLVQMLGKTMASVPWKCTDMF